MGKKGWQSTQDGTKEEERALLTADIWNPFDQNNEFNDGNFKSAHSTTMMQRRRLQDDRGTMRLAKQYDELEAARPTQKTKAGVEVKVGAVSGAQKAVQQELLKMLFPDHQEEDAVPETWCSP